MAFICGHEWSVFHRGTTETRFCEMRVKVPGSKCRYHDGSERKPSTISALRAQLSERERERDEAIAQLRRVEWINFGGACSANCPECGLHKKDGHHKSCGLAALLAKKGGA